MTIDHYRVLGVQPDAEEVVIRAAYLALMRRYHPDQNDSQLALEKSQEVSAAYAVLSDPERRNEYDAKRSRDHLAPSAGVMPRRKSNRGRTAALLIATGTLGLLGFVITRTPSENVASVRPDTALATGTTVLAPGPNTNDCASRVDPKALRQALFAEASRLGGSDRAALRLAAASSMVRVSDVEADEDNALGHWKCSATVAVVLPPGTVTAGGQSRIVADLQYTVDRAPGGEKQHVAVAQGELIATSLAAVRRDTPITRSPVLAAMDDVPVLAPMARAIAPSAKQRAPQSPPLPQPEPQEQRQLPRTVRTVATPPIRTIKPARPAPIPKLAANAPGKAPASPQARPAAGCQGGSGRSSARACSKANLAYLDRLSVMLYNQSFTNADAAKRTRLLRSRAEFQARLNGCSSDDCRKSTYLGRNVEINAIMRSQPS